MVFRYKIYHKSTKATLLNATMMLVTSCIAAGLIFLTAEMQNYFLLAITVIIYVILRVLGNKITDKIALKDQIIADNKERKRIQDLDTKVADSYAKIAENTTERFTYPATITIKRKSAFHGIAAKIKYSIKNSVSQDEPTVSLRNGSSDALQVFYSSNLVFVSSGLNPNSLPIELNVSEGERVALTFSAFKLVKIERE